MLKASLTHCPPELAGQVVISTRSYPDFYCYSDPQNGGPCVGDEGGEHERYLASK